VGNGLFRLRVLHVKEDAGAWLSHLELTRSCERAIRRAGLPYAITKGFHPKMRVAFGPALPVGTGSQAEYYEVWLTEHVPAKQALCVLEDATPTVLRPVAMGYVSDSERSLAATLTVARYDVVLETAMGPEELGTALEEEGATGRLVVERKGKQKVFELDRCLPEKPSVTGSTRGGTVSLTVRMSPEGSLRPEHLVKDAFDTTGTPYRIVRITRTDLLMDEGDGFRRPLE